LQTYLPSWRQRRRGGAAYVEPLFPGYLFVQCDGCIDWQLRARSAPNVVRLLGGDNGPEAVPPSLIDEIRHRCEQQIATPFVPGERVRVMHGPFRELDAVFDSDCSSRDRARILVHLLNRLVPVVVDVQSLRRAL